MTNNLKNIITGLCEDFLNIETTKLLQPDIDAIKDRLEDYLDKINKESEGKILGNPPYILCTDIDYATGRINFKTNNEINTILEEYN